MYSQVFLSLGDVMLHLSSPRVARSIIVTTFGALWLVACAQGETLDGFGGAYVAGGTGGSAGVGKGSSSATTATTSAQASSASSTKASTASTTVASTSTTVATTAVATTVTVVTNAAVTSGGSFCFDVCTEGPPPDLVACISDQNTLGCISGICLVNSDCCNVMWDSTCTLSAILAGCDCP